MINLIDNNLAMSEEKGYSPNERDKIEKAIELSESDFEKNIVYLTAGTLALSIGYIEKLVPLKLAQHKYLLVIAWTLLALSLLLNLASHLISSRNSSRTRDEIDDEIQYKKLIRNIRRRNSTMFKINWVSYSQFAIGVITIIIFSAINIYHMSNNSKSNNNAKKVVVREIKLGRQTPIPTPVSSIQTKPKEK